jgi:hypothetical protein
MTTCAFNEANFDLAPTCGQRCIMPLAPQGVSTRVVQTKVCTHLSFKHMACITSPKKQVCWCNNDACTGLVQGPSATLPKTRHREPRLTQSSFGLSTLKGRIAGESNRGPQTDLASFNHFREVEQTRQCTNSMQSVAHWHAKQMQDQCHVHSAAHWQSRL